MEYDRFPFDFEPNENIFGSENRKENCHHDHFSFNFKGNGIRVFPLCTSRTVGAKIGNKKTKFKQEKYRRIAYRETAASGQIKGHPEYHITMVPRGLREGLSLASLLQGDVRLSHGRCEN